MCGKKTRDNTCVQKIESLRTDVSCRMCLDVVLYEMSPDEEELHQSKSRQRVLKAESYVKWRMRVYLLVLPSYALPHEDSTCLRDRTAAIDDTPVVQGTEVRQDSIGICSGFGGCKFVLVMPPAVRSDSRSTYRKVHYIHLLSSIDMVPPFPVTY